mmetsp:Transcript_19797/g.24419  ORF Transcript_19797/g.24419 Transcript_19797/m.24419 type:complete len:206 (-) Transcript_19797:2-619(-)
MKFVRQLLCFVLYTLSVTQVWAGNDENDEYGFFYFDASVDFTEGAIYPRACVNMSDGDFVVFDIYQSNHNSCKKKSLGTYRADLQSFVLSYAKQQRQDNEQNNGNGYEVEDDVLQLTQCQQYYYNNNMFFLKLGCRESTGKGFQINAYKDMYCTEKASSNYNLGLDISSLRVNFDTCKNCKSTSTYSQYAANANYYGGEKGQNYT